MDINKPSVLPPPGVRDLHGRLTNELIYAVCLLGWMGSHWSLPHLPPHSPSTYYMLSVGAECIHLSTES